MSHEGFTKGPWEVRTKTCIGGPAPCIDYDHGNVGGQIASLALCDNAAANARLIASAPDLLEALQNLTDNIVIAFPALEMLGSITAARTAISKATGQTTMSHEMGDK